MRFAACGSSRAAGNRTRAARCATACPSTPTPSRPMPNVALAKPRARLPAPLALLRARRRPARDTRAARRASRTRPSAIAMPASSSRTIGTSRGSVGHREQRIDAGAEIEDRAAHANALEQPAAAASRRSRSRRRPARPARRAASIVGQRARERVAPLRRLATPTASSTSTARGHASSRSTRSAPSLTRSPTAQLTAVTTPARGRDDRVLHLHRLEHAQRRALLDLVARP